MGDLVGQIANGDKLFVIVLQKRRSLFWRSFWCGFFSVIIVFILVGIFV